MKYDLPVSGVTDGINIWVYAGNKFAT